MKNDNLKILYPTGIEEFDKVSIYKDKSYKNDNGESYIGNGISSGSILLLAIHEDVSSDDTTVDNIIKSITSSFDKSEVYNYDSCGSNAELFYHNMACAIRNMYGSKGCNKENYKYFTGYYNDKGEKIYGIQPTVVVLTNPPSIDSVNGANAVSAFFRDLRQHLSDMNIILIITTKLINSFSSFIPGATTIKQFVPTGDIPIYFADTLFEVHDDKYRVIKSRYSASGQIIKRNIKAEI